jgi:hypothetical protein
MTDVPSEIDHLRFDAQILRTMIDAALARGASGDDVILRACGDVLYDRRTRLEELERALPNHDSKSQE